MNSSNKIVEINVAVFGFSRGATTARAFVNRLVEKRCDTVAGGKLRTKSGYPVRIRFMGLYDTVASVGVPMSANNIATTKAASDARGMIAARLSNDNRDVWPSTIAFSRGGTPGADPAPGKYDGHKAYGGNIAIANFVENVQHYIAAHELRNSFPVDSVSTLQGGKVQRPEKFKEYVYPGVHSDVGGSYRPGEGGRSEDSTNKLGLIPLHQMYEAAIAAGVPLLPKAAWSALQLSDFAIGIEVAASYNYYMSQVGKGSTVGDLINAHMRIYYAWRFQEINKQRSGDKHEAQAIRRSESTFSSERSQLNAEILKLEAAQARLQDSLDVMSIQEQSFAYMRDSSDAKTRAVLDEYDASVGMTQMKFAAAKDATLRAKAKRDALPDHSELEGQINFYDEQLIRDALSIRKMYGPNVDRPGPALRARKDLRPHYKALMDAFENEFFNGTGMRDQRIIEFFDKYVNDSLASFAKDATLPSDPRVVYVGEDNKMNYASNTDLSEDGRMVA